MIMQNHTSLFASSARTNLCTLDEHERLRLILEFWPQSQVQPRDIDEENYRQYFDYLGGELAELEGYRESFAAQSFESLLAIIQELRRGRPKNEIVRSLQLQFLNVTHDSVIRSVELAARLWLTTNIQTDVGPLHIGETVMAWNTDTALDVQYQTFVDKLQTANSSKLESTSFSHILTAVNLADVYNIRIHWSDNLLDHLRLEGNILFVYRHKICLENHSRAGNSCMIPQGVVGEAIDTLNLLFLRDEKTRAFLRKEGQEFYSVGNCNREIVRDIKHYTYWRDRLLALQDILDRPPNTVRQLWSDRRNVDRWFGFWTSTCSITLAVVGIIITTIASIVGSFYTAKQYEIALAQACLMPDAKVLLPKFCF